MDTQQQMFGRRLRELRIQRGLSQQAVADSVGTISQSLLAFYEAGRGSPSVERLLDLAKFFGVGLDYLYGMEEAAASSTQVQQS